jgi:hypothetical protein
MKSGGHFPGSVPSMEILLGLASISGMKPQWGHVYRQINYNSLILK